MDDNEITETPQPETGAGDSDTPHADPTPETETTEPEKGKGKDPADEVAKWKAMARKNEATAKETKKALDKALAEQQAILDNIAKALGLKKGEEVDPAKLAEQLTGERDHALGELRQARVELAVYKAAGKHGADPDALLDSRSFLRAVAQLNPDDDGFADAIADAIKEAVKANPKLAAEQPKPPQRSGGEMPGAPSGPPPRKRPTSLFDAVQRRMGS